MARNTPYQYKPDDDVTSVASQFGITPQQLINANQGGFPVSVGQTINIPNFNSPGAPNPYAPAIQAGNVTGNNTALPPRGVPRQYQQYVNAARPPVNFTTANSFYTPPQQPTPQGQQPYWQLAAGGPNPTNFTSANSFTNAAGGVNLQTGMNNNQFVTQLGERILQNPAEFDSLPQSAQDAIRQSLGGGGGGQPAADPANSPGGRFIQVGEVRWERNKNGRLVKVQYTGGGSWRNKRVVQGAKGQHKQLVAQRGAQAPQQENAQMTGFGVINFSAGSG